MSLTSSYTKGNPTSSPAYDRLSHDSMEKRHDTAIRETAAASAAVAGAGTLADVLTERGHRYGKFVSHAAVTQDLKMLTNEHLASRNKTLPADMQEALDMIFHKIGRIVNGDHNYADSWVDIAGYAKLVADRLEGVTR